MIDSTYSTSPTLAHPTLSAESLGSSGLHALSPFSPVLPVCHLKRPGMARTPARPLRVVGRLCGGVWTAPIAARHVRSVTQSVDERRDNPKASLREVLTRQRGRCGYAE